MQRQRAGSPPLPPLPLTELLARQLAIPSAGGNRKRQITYPPVCGLGWHDGMRLGLETPPGEKDRVTGPTKDSLTACSNLDLE